MFKVQSGGVWEGGGEEDEAAGRAVSGVWHAKRAWGYP